MFASFRAIIKHGRTASFAQQFILTRFEFNERYDEQDLIKLVIIQFDTLSFLNLKMNVNGQSRMNNNNVRAMFLSAMPSTPMGCTVKGTFVFSVKFVSF